MCLAVPGKILSCTGDDPLERVGRVSFAGIVRDVSLAYVPEAQVGDYAIFFRRAAVEITFEDTKYLVVPQAAILTLVRETRSPEDEW